MASRRRRLQPDQLPQRDRVASRHGARRVGPRPPRLRRRGAARRPVAHRGCGALRLVAPRGVRRLRARRDALPDRLSDGCATAGLGRRNADPARPRPPRDRARPRAPASRLDRDRRAARAGSTGYASRAFGRMVARWTAAVERGRVTIDEVRRCRVGLVCPVWFPVPPEAYGGTERVVALLADGLVDAGHDVTLFASGDSQTARSARVRLPHGARANGSGTRTGRCSTPCTRSSRPTSSTSCTTTRGCSGSRSAGSSTRRSVTRCTGRSTDSRAGCTSRCSSSRRTAKLISISMNQRRPKEHLPWIANCPNALDLSMYPFRRKPGGDYSRLPRPHEPGQGGSSRPRGGAGDGHPAQDRREVPRAARDPLLRRVHPPAPRRRDRVRRRGRSRRQGRAADGRTRADLPDRLGGAVRADDDRGDGVRDARSSRRGAAPFRRSSTTGAPA